MHAIGRQPHWALDGAAIRYARHRPELIKLYVFAVLHAPATIVPVFILGACAALVYERSKMLPAPMITPAVYNAVIVTYHLLAPN